MFTNSEIEQNKDELLQQALALTALETLLDARLP